jgi:twinkle protein
VSNIRLAKMQLKQFSATNLEDHIDLFDAAADKFQKLPMYYLTFHGAQQVRAELSA